MYFDPANSRTVVSIYLAGSIGNDNRWRPGVITRINRACGTTKTRFLSPVDQGISYNPIMLKLANDRNKVYLHCDYAKIDAADVVFAYVCKSLSRHSGTSAEIGYACARGKLIILVNDMEPHDAVFYDFIKLSADAYFTSLDKGLDFLEAYVKELDYNPMEAIK